MTARTFAGNDGEGSSSRKGPTSVEGERDVKPGVFMKVSVFDLDRTLTRHPTYTAFLLFASYRLAPWRLVCAPLVPFLMLACAARVISRRDFKVLEHRLLLGRSVPGVQARAIGADFARFVHDRWIYPAAKERLSLERREGRLIVIASAANSIYVEPLAKILGADTVLCTKSRWAEGQLVGAIEGDNCYGRTKRDTLCAWILQQGVPRERTHIRFFSDDLSDEPSFRWADEKTAVNPSRALRRRAAAEEWPLLDWSSSHD